MTGLRVRLALLGTGVVALAVVIFGLLIFALASGSAGPDQDSALKRRAEATAQALNAGGTPPSGAVPVDLRSSNDVFVEGVDADGAPVFSTGVVDGAPPSPPATLLQQAVARQGAFGTVGSGTARLRLYVLPAAGAAPVAFLVAGQATRVPAANVGGLGVFIVLSAIPALLAALAASWLVAGRAMRDLSRANQRLAAAFDGQRRFVADASHELRTPLTTIQVNSGLLARGPALPEEVRAAAARDIAGESERMGRLVDQLLTLAHADSGVRLQLLPLDLKLLVEDVGRQAATKHPERRLSIVAATAPVRGDEDALRQLLWILVENACRHSRPAGGIAVRLWAEAGWARLEVSDEGPGIPPHDLERIFLRFQRVDPARSGGGAGLGLAIARWLAAEHGGRVLARNNHSGGASLHVDLPLLPVS